MIVTKYFRTREDGVVLNISYSDKGMFIERDGVQYSEAVDPADLNREYVETDVPIVDESDFATEEDYLEALRLLGVSE